jgi:hypothetical protein
MTATVTILQSALYTTLGNFIMSMLGLDAAHVVQGYPNRVAMPVGPFVNMTIISMKRLRTNVDTIPDGGFPTEVSAEQGTQVDMQLDCYGPASGDWATILTTLLRDNVGCVALAPTCQPLYADDPIRSPLVDAEQQYEDRWILNARIQYNPATVTIRQYADTLGPVGIIDVEVSYSP